MNHQVLHQQRTENILLSLKKLDYLTRSQLQILHNLKGDRNANRVLKNLDEYISCFRHGLEKVYYLNKNGRERVQCEKVRKKTPNIQHFLIRNQFYIHMQRPSTWENEIKVSVGELSIVCDAKFEYKGTPCFVEIDISQPMVKNKSKIDKYKKMKELTGDPFYLIWVTELESRRYKLTQLCEGLVGKIYTFNDIK
jgi:Replication-relaxation